MTGYNRPYVLQLAVALMMPGLDDTHYSSVRSAAESNGVSAEELDRAAFVVDGVQRGGVDLDEWIRQEFIVDGWLHGYVPLELDPSDPKWSTWKLAQFNDEHYNVQTVFNRQPGRSDEQDLR
ncbi:hypothetical protein KC238_24980 [Mycobacteroides chelonae]|uniref:hypothetical protein n=1 Tax=Mycobacteroides chelonae TaxID=1774 RepID=UPI001C2C584A|nr:hypothetical protein [Mycobacteroides chelonae]MBV0920516.1 hypothetical protein [Mycobacteroides chelonae]